MPGIVVNRVENPDAYTDIEEGLVNRLLEVRQRLIDANLGAAIAAPSWLNGQYVNTRESAE